MTRLPLPETLRQAVEHELIPSEPVRPGNRAVVMVDDDGFVSYQEVARELVGGATVVPVLDRAWRAHDQLRERYDL